MKYNRRYIRERRRELNMTQTELAEKLGFKTAGPISRIESGKRHPDARELELLAEALEVDGLGPFFKPVVLAGAE